METWLKILAFALALSWIGFRVWKVNPRPAYLHCNKNFIEQSHSDAKNNNYAEYKASSIIPLPEFDWRTTEPLKFRNFKAKYHLTMGLSNSTLSELIEMDRNYLERMQVRRQIMNEHHEIAIQTGPEIKPAVNEFYIWLTNIYLPTRFPTMFTISGTFLLNHATSKSFPLQPPPNPVETFEILGANLDHDFLLLLPAKDGDGYVLKGYVTCFPAGFNTKEKFEMKLRDIHKPVPGYKEKLDKSMDRFFDKLEVGKIVERSNWSVSTNDRLFSASGNHLYEGEEPQEEEVDINRTFLRCERQTLHRLPKTKALVFSFKTYMYPLKDIKEEGLGEGLAQAIDGLKEGSVPEIALLNLRRCVIAIESRALIDEGHITRPPYLTCPKVYSLTKSAHPATPGFRDLLHKYSKIPTDDVDSQLETVVSLILAIPLPFERTSTREPDLNSAMKPGSDDALPHSGSAATTQALKTYYDTILRILKAGGKFFDVGCMFSQDTRKLVYDSVPAENVYRTDLHAEYFEFGHKLFRDEKIPPRDHFIAADILDNSPGNTLGFLEGKISVLNAIHLIHVFSLFEQKSLLKRFITLLKPEMGVMVTGRMKGIWKREVTS
ncbi:hypothetical protein G7Y89_g11518 [Cudoniella acicularis]|uniref:Uncharacterized protein n=1 Tax=Cudoniella acicularis TaxID=354080 RepID=A0A8H4RC75_9HELO|nr:hypothetical protein G7Y89_g11518 [Cudoniella acicularis]